jgi:phytoene desaturase
VVIGAGVAGLACAVRLAHAGHEVTVLEQAERPGGKAGRVEQDGLAWDSGPSLLTMPWVLEDLFADTGSSLADELELLPVEPVTRYHFADGSQVELFSDTERSVAALEAWAPGTGAAWRRFLAICASMWRASVPFLTGPPPWPPRRDARGDPRGLLRVRPWHTLRSLARALTSDRRLQMVIERFATYAGADPRRAPAALAVAGYVEHAFGAWHPRGGLYELVLALERRLLALGGALHLGARVEGLDRAGGRVLALHAAGAGRLPADAVVAAVDADQVDWLLGRRPARHERSLSGLALMLTARGGTAGRAHHAIHFPANYDAEFDDVFVHRRPPGDPTVYAVCPSVTERANSGTDPLFARGGAGSASKGSDPLFALANAPARVDGDWEALEARMLARLGGSGELVTVARRSPADLERETGAAAIYGIAPHGRLGTLKRPGPRVRGVENLWRVGGTVHPGGGLPLVMLGAATVARELTDRLPPRSR